MITNYGQRGTQLHDYCLTCPNILTHTLTT